MDMSELRHLDNTELGLRGEFSGEMRRDEPMAKHVSWRAGGRAAHAYFPADLDDLVAFLKQRNMDEPLLFVGLGSNLLVRDGGFNGTVIFTHTALKNISLEHGAVYAQAGVASPKVARFAAKQGLKGAEFLAGIPGTVGGALAMNAGCYGGETWQIASRVQTVDAGGVLRVRSAQDFEIAYRHVALNAAQTGQGEQGKHFEEWFVAAWFELAAGDEQVSRETIRSLLEKRIASQPLQLPNAGSVFRNPVGDHAARLIEAAGLKGLQIGGAQVSEKHANFIVNVGAGAGSSAGAGTASASDIERLIETVQRVVQEKMGIELVREVQIVGEQV